ncbi:MAG TPA: iron ABC transporter permease [Segeticoccus sp.]|nr:iron ABC transporter permease [Segeticoccus sp.]HET8600800.1 iron ABC transporter permease [Segeticoccus sp.]
MPVAGMLARGFLQGGHLDLGAMVEVLTRPRTLRILWFTLWMATLATVLTVVLGLPVAYALYRLRLPGRRLLRALVVMPFVLPSVVVGVAFRTLLASNGPLGFLGLDGSWVAILAALVFFNLAVVVRTVGGTWEGLDRRAEESAAALGAPPVRVLRTVTVPALLPSIVSAATVVFLFCATAFGVVLTLGGLRYGTVETEIYLLTTQFLDLRAASVLSILQLLAVVLLLTVAGRTRARKERALRRGAVTANLRAPARSDIPSLLVTGLVLVFVALPLAAMVGRSLQVGDGWGLDNYRALGNPDATTALLVPVWTALHNSFAAAVDATMIALTLGLIVSVLVSRRPRGRVGRRAVGALDGIVMLPLGISAVTVGFGFLITLDRPPLDLRSSAVLIPIAQAMVALPLVVRTLVPAMRAIDPRLRQAAATLGASPVRAALAVDLPLVWRPLLAATGFAFAVSLGEFGATSFLSRPQRPTLPVVIYQLISRPGPENFGMALAGSVVLCVVTVAVMGAVERLRVGSMGTF